MEKILIATAITAGAAAILFLVKRRHQQLQPVEQQPSEPSRHLTNVFAKAKQSRDHNDQG